MGVHVSVCGPVPVRGLIASNHVSYLDILVLSATARCSFVSKSEVKSWPLVGWIAAMTGTVFVDRGRRSQTHRLYPQMQERLQSGERLVLFPEGTSSDGRGVLPFHSSFFEAAVAGAAPVTATHLSYQLADGDGDPATDVCYWGEMTLFPHVIKLLTKSSVRAVVRFATKPQVFSHRKQAALGMHCEVEAFAEAAEGHIQEGRKASSILVESLAANPDSR
jgi:1-acyl-sn-glycerol-3-phosphate acyltransferase